MLEFKKKKLWNFLHITTVKTILSILWSSFSCSNTESLLRYLDQTSAGETLVTSTQPRQEDGVS
jgi:hypothetical protein